MSADKKSVTKKIKNIILVIFAALIVSYIIWTVCTMRNYVSIKKVYDLDEQEYAAICGEYFLDPQTADIEYIFCRGRDSWGCRLLLSENDLEDMNVLFSERVFDDENSDYFKLKEGYDGAVYGEAEPEKFRLNFSETSSVKMGSNVFCYVFEADGKYYMEMDKQWTDNAKIYTKNIRS